MYIESFENTMENYKTSSLVNKNTLRHKSLRDKLVRAMVHAKATNKSTVYNKSGKPYLNVSFYPLLNIWSIRCVNKSAYFNVKNTGSTVVQLDRAEDVKAELAKKDKMAKRAQKRKRYIKRMKSNKVKSLQNRLLNANPYCCYCNHRLVKWYTPYFDSAKKSSKNCSEGYTNSVWFSKWYATIEHIIPRSKGGQNNISNLMLACEGCNKERGNKELLQLACN